MLVIYNIIDDLLQYLPGYDTPISNSNKNQILNKSIIKKELLSFPSVGVYEGETKEEWEKFVKQLETIYNDIDRDRRVIIDKVKVEMSKRKDLFDDLLQDIGLNSASSIRKIYNQLKIYIPCAEYKKLIDAITQLEKAEILMNQYKQPDSDIKSKILAGLRKKYPEIECQQKFLEVIEKNKLVVENGKKQIDEITVKVQGDSKYQRFELMKKELQPYFDEWISVDSNIGKENIQVGKLFEEKCEKDGVNLILKELKLNRRNVKILTNLKWADCPGEIDIAILDKNETKVICLAECKSRLFDIAQGYKQSGPDRAAEKLSIQLYKKTIPVPRDIPCYVLTGIRQNDSFLGVESKIKQELTRCTLENEYAEVDFDELYTLLRSKFDKIQSPLSWFNKYSQTNLFVLA